MRVPDAQLKTFVIDSGLVSRKDFELAEQAAKDKNQPLPDMLVSRGLVGEDDLRRMQAHILGIPFVSLEGSKIDFAILSLIPEPIARANNVIAYKKDATSLEVAMLDTNNLEALNFIKKKTGLKIEPRLTGVNSIKGALLQYQKSLKDEFGDIIKTASLSVQDTSNLDAAGLKQLAEDVPIVKVVDTLLRHAVIQDASDIHIEPLENILLIRYRIDGILHDAMELPKNVADGITARIKVLAHLKLDEKRLPQDGRFKMESDSERVSFRVSVMPTYSARPMSLRYACSGPTPG